MMQSGCFQCASVKGLEQVVDGNGERLDNDPSGARYGCFLPDLTGLARRLPAPTSRGGIYALYSEGASLADQRCKRILWNPSSVRPQSSGPKLEISSK